MVQGNKIIMVSGVTTPDFSRIKKPLIDKVSVPLKFRLVLRHLLLILGLLMVDIAFSADTRWSLVIASSVLFMGYRYLEYKTTVFTKTKSHLVGLLARDMGLSALTGVVLGVILSGYGQYGFALYMAVVGAFYVVRYRFKGSVMGVVEDSLLLFVPLWCLLWAVKGLEGLLIGQWSTLLNYVSVIAGILFFIVASLFRDKVVYRIKVKQTRKMKLSLVSHATGLVVIATGLSMGLQGLFMPVVILVGLLLIMSGILLSERRGYMSLRHIL